MEGEVFTCAYMRPDDGSVVVLYVTAAASPVDADSFASMLERAIADVFNRRVVAYA